MSLGPSLHLAWSELRCRDAIGTPYPLDLRETAGVALGRAFEALRAECTLVNGMDTPLVVLEGYRTDAYQAMLRQNPRYKAALHSQHCTGRAVDVALPRGLTFDEFADCAKRAACRNGSPIRYIELRPSMSYVHVDCRETKKLVVETVA
jgi:uncharacterized protein YcbK (DUF882 family)